MIDPVMVAESGAVLLDDDARAALVDAAAAARDRDHAEPARGARARGRRRAEDVEELARALHALGPAVVVVTGGHREEATDVFFDGESIHLIPGERHPDGAAHGSGCTHSSALAAHLALGHSPLEAAAGGARDRRRGRPRRAARARRAAPGPVDVLGLTARRARRP